jgi:hypothetical protein
VRAEDLDPPKVSILASVFSQESSTLHQLAANYTMAPLYARYVPPKAKHTKDTASVAPLTPEISAAKEEPKKEKRSKDQPKKRKREKEEEVEEEGGEDKKLKKHKSVLSKFEKASKKADAARETAATVPAEDVREDTPIELHGGINLTRFHTISGLI